MYLGKSESILFGTKCRLQKSNKIKVTCNGNEIISLTWVTYLGITLDQSLSGEFIAEKIVYKSACNLEFMCCRMRQFDITIKKLLVTTLIQSYFDYACSTRCSGLTTKLRNKMQVRQNNMICYLLHVPPRTHAGGNKFKKVGLLPVQLRVEQLKLYGIQ